jgi:hypothetical protein
MTSKFNFETTTARGVRKRNGKDKCDCKWIDISLALDSDMNVWIGAYGFDFFDLGSPPY